MPDVLTPSLQAVSVTGFTIVKHYNVGSNIHLSELGFLFYPTRIRYEHRMYRIVIITIRESMYRIVIITYIYYLLIKTNGALLNY